MKGISIFFDKFNNIALKELKKREIICQAIYKSTKQIIELEEISIKEGVVSVKGDQGLKSEIFLKKKSIIDILLKSNIKIVDIK